jgi:Ca2+-dependent lipid-binding protein
VEIVSATDLPMADLKSSDPYVTAWLGKTQVHKTSAIHNTCDPIWAVDTQSIFILSATANDFFHANAGLTFIVKDYDAVGKNDVLGKVNVSQKVLLEAKGERMECELQVMLKNFDPKKAVYPPKLNLRIRPATKEDFKFVKTLFSVKSKKTLGVYANAAFVAPHAHTVNRLKRETKRTDKGPLVC